MPRRGLKYLRVAVATLIFGRLLAAFVDFRGLMPPMPGHALAHLQFGPGLVSLLTGTASIGVVVLVVGLAAAAIFGRVYCSAICPLGIFQDVVARMAGWFRRKRKPLLFRPALTWVRQLFLWGTIAGIVCGGSGLVLALLDPYSIFGRIASGLFRPLVTLANNALVGVAGSVGIGGLYRADPQWAAAGALALPVVMLLLIVGLAAWRGRLYCNTVCPVGTLLGFLSARSALRLGIDPAACRKCGDCLRVCKAQCIDLRTRSIDASRCVACYNCLAVCEQHAVAHRSAWSHRPTPPAPAPSAAVPPGAPADPQRRAFITEVGAMLATAAGGSALLVAEGARRHLHRERPGDGGGRGESSRRQLGHNETRAISPPGAGSEEQFLDRCTACHLCISACPTHVLQPAFLEYGLTGLMKPRMDYAAAFCNFDCHVCSDVCPDGALQSLSLEEKHTTKIGVAHLDVEHCIVKTQGTDCAACSEHCPTKAVETQPYGDNLRLPSVNPASCIGCGACEYACPAEPKAIRVTGHATHIRVRPRPEEKLSAPPRTDGDFPF